MENKWLYLTAFFVLISITSAIPIEPEPGAGVSNMPDPGSTPSHQTPLPSLPLSAAVAAGALFLLMNLKTDLKTYLINPRDERLHLKSAGGEWIQQSFSNNNEYLQYLRNIVGSSKAEEVPVRNSDGRWVLGSSSYVSRYLSMLDSAKKRLAELEKEGELCRTRLFTARRRARRNGHTRDRHTVFAEKAYNKVLYEIEEVKKTIGTLESWAGNLSGLDFNVDEGFKFNDRTFFFSNGVVRGITAEEVYHRIRKEADEAYDEFTASMKKIRSHLKANIKAGGWGLVDSTKELLESTYKDFMSRLDGLRDEYRKEQNGRGGSWNKYYEKLYENYFKEFREKSEGLFEECSLSVDKLSFAILVPESVKLELKIQERKALEKEKLIWREKKRRWSQQLRDKANRLQKNLLDEYRRIYDKKIFAELKEKIDAWCDKARDDARKMKWQRTLEKAEAKCQIIDLFLTDGFNSFNALTHQKTAAEVTEEYYKPKIEIKEVVEEYRKEEQPTNPVPPQQDEGVTPVQNDPDPLDNLQGVCMAPIIYSVFDGGGNSTSFVPVVDLDTGILGVYMPEKGALIWNFKDKFVDGSYGDFVLGLDYNSSVVDLKFGNSSSVFWDYGGKNLEGFYGDFVFGVDYNTSIARFGYGNNTAAVWDSQNKTVEGSYNGFNGVLDYGDRFFNVSYGNLTGFNLDFMEGVLTGYYGSHNLRVDSGSMDLQGVSGWEPVNQPVNLFYSLDATKKAEKPNAGSQSNSFSLFGFSLEEGNWDVELNLLPFAFSKRVKNVGEVSVEGCPGVYFWNRGEEFELGEELDVSLKADIKGLCLGKYCIPDLGVGFQANVDAPLLKKEVLEDGSRRLTSYPGFNQMLELLEYEASKDVSVGGNVVGVSEGLSGLEFRILPASTGLLTGASNPKDKLDQWCVDYMLNKFSKVIPEDQRTLLSSDYLTVRLDDPTLSDEFMRKDTYQYNKTVGSETYRTSEFYSSSDCPEGEVVCEKVEAVTEEAPWLPVFEFVGGCVGDASDFIYSVFKSFGLDNVL